MTDDSNIKLRQQKTKMLADIAAVFRTVQKSGDIQRLAALIEHVRNDDSFYHMVKMKLEPHIRKEFDDQLITSFSQTSIDTNFRPIPGKNDKENKDKLMRIEGQKISAKPPSTPVVKKNA